MDVKKLTTRTRKFIRDNELDFSSTGSELNGNCTILAGFICYIIESSHEGEEIIENLHLSSKATTELERVFEYAWTNNYEDYWETEKAKLEYIF